MSFLLKKLIQPFLMPTCFIFLCICFGTALVLKRKARAGKYLLFLGIILFYLLSIKPVSNFLLRPLENKYAPISKTSNVDTIVVLAGGLRNKYSNLPPTSLLEAGSAFRLMEAIRLYYLLSKPRIIISGGSGNPFLTNLYIAKEMKKMLVSMGIPEDRIICECRSRDTYENAREVGRIVGKKPFILVTSAYHMPRSIFIFRKLGMNPIPSPADFLAQDRKYTFFDFIPRAKELWKSELAFHEYLGMMWYKIRY